MIDHKENIINCLKKMRNNAENIFQIRAYDKIIKNIENFKEPIVKYEQIENIDGAGKKTKLKFKEIIETGGLKASESVRKDDIKSELLQVYGIGPKKVKDLIDKYKIKSLYDLRLKSSKDPEILTDAQKIGLFCYEDLLERIPRSEMLQHKKIIKKGEIVGSFRRKEESSGDIDVMINMTSEEFENYVDSLIKKKYIKYILAKGDKKMLGICSLEGGKLRRLDLIRNSPEEYPYMILYFTGSAKFNVAFRQHCLKMGFSLNEHSFTPRVEGLKTEKDIFRHVGLEFVEPENRIDEYSLKL